MKIRNKLIIAFSTIIFIMLLSTVTVMGAELGNYGLVDDGYRPNFPDESSQTSRTIYPTKYDPREINAVTPVHNQGGAGACWAFASIGTMEQVVYKQTGLKCDFSEEALRYAISNKLKTKTKKDLPDIGLYNRDIDIGAHFSPAMQYLTRPNSPISNDISWLSPNLEKDVPYNGDSNVVWYNKMSTSYGNAYITGAHFEQYYQNDNDYSTDENSHFCKNIQNMKRVISDYGGCFLTFHMDEYYLNLENGAYYYNENNDSEIGIDHAVTCVGWDDNYSKNNFNSKCRPTHNGAWLVKNSWDTDIGDNGFLWISYEDKYVYHDYQICVVDEVSKVSKNEKTLSYDYAPIKDKSVKRKTLPNESTCMANIYNVSQLKSTYDTINKVTFYTSNIRTDYNIYIVPLGLSQGIDNVDSYGEVKSFGSIDYEGYYTAYFDEAYKIPDNASKIAVVVEFINKKSISADIYYNTEVYQANTQKYPYNNSIIPVINAKESYYMDGTNHWKDLSTNSEHNGGNICIRPTLVRKTPITENSTLSAYTKDFDGSNVKININLNGNLLYRVKDINDNTLYQDKDYFLSNGTSDGSVLRFSLKSTYLSDLDIGESRTIIFEFTDGSDQALVITHKVNVPSVYIDGIAAYGQTLRAYLGDNYNAPDDLNYQWQRSNDGNTWYNINGATSSTYTINIIDIGKYLRVFTSAKSDGIYFYGQARNSHSVGVIAIIYGDVNMDGVVTTQDIETIKNYLNKEIEFTTCQHVLADVNGDGNINNTDISLITQFINRVIDHFPVEN